MWHSTSPHPFSLLLANHHTTLLYLGHSNVLLLSPLADTLCCNLQKIGWKEEKSEEIERFEKPTSKTESLLMCFPFNYSICLHLFLFLCFFISCKQHVCPAATKELYRQPLPFPGFYSGVVSHCAHVINEILSQLVCLKWI